MNKYNFQVGDYCFYDGDTDYECPLKVDGVTENDISVEEEGFLGGIEGVVVPYPITDDWLDLNFERYYPFPDDKYDNYWRSEDHRLTISTLSNMVARDYDVKCIRRIHLDNKDFETIGGNAACYVHHIQHLCRDCEYEFEPKFK